jgi:hypothetical protein
VNIEGSVALVTGATGASARAPRDHELLYPPLEQFWDAAIAARGCPAASAQAGRLRWPRWRP